MNDFYMGIVIGTVIGLSAGLVVLGWLTRLGFLARRKPAEPVTTLVGTPVVPSRSDKRTMPLHLGE